MTSRTLDELLQWIVASDTARANGQPERARLLDLLIRATLYRHGLRWRDCKQIGQIDRMIARSHKFGTAD